MSGPILRRYRIFLASPGDLEEERRRTSAIVEEVNRQFREVDLHFALLGWEDTLPGAGRPQQLINRDVDSCDLFVGLLWKRWGTDTGAFSSGFEEEFRRAMERRRSSGAPEVWLAFKTVDAATLADPGVQLQRVIAFKEEVRASREVLFKEFASVADWVDLVRNWLVRQGLIETRKLLDPTSAASTSPNSAAPGRSEPAAGVRVPPPLADLLSQLTDTSASLEEFVAQASALDEFEVARIQLLSKTLVSAKSTHETLTTHEANLLYRFRARVVASNAEKRLLLRTVVTDRHDYVPGFFWLSEHDLSQFTQTLLELVSQDSSDEVRGRAADCIRRFEVPLSTNDWETLATNLFATRSGPVRSALASLFEERGDESTLQLVESDAEFSQTEVASGIRTRILCRTRPSRALPSIHDQLFGKNDAIEDIRAHASQLDCEELRSLMGMAGPQVRRFAFGELAQRAEIDVDACRVALKDPSRAMREIALRHILTLGVQYTPDEIRDLLKEQEERSTLFSSSGPSIDVDDTIRAAMAHWDDRQLESAIDWYSLDGPNAYEMFMERHFSEKAGVLREDFWTDFARLKAAAAKRTATMLANFQRFDDLFTGLYTIALLRVLSRQGADEDIAVAERALSHSGLLSNEVRVAAVRVVGRYGSARNVEPLFGIALNSYGELKDLAGCAAFDLTDEPEELLGRALATNDGTLIRLGVDALATRKGAEATELLAQVLRHETDIARLAALYRLSELWEAAELALLLASYTTGRYYYDVVAWLDRLIFLPSELRPNVRRELAKKAIVSS